MQKLLQIVDSYFCKQLLRFFTDPLQCCQGFRIHIFLSLLLFNRNDTVVNRLSAIVYFHIAVRICLLDFFAKAFGIQFADKDNTLKYVHQTSWGMTTRLIGALIMVHGDNSGLVLPPKVAPTQVVIIPIQQRKEGVLDKAYELKDRLSNFRVKVDDTDKSPGWKFAEAEMRGIPVRVEIGPKDIEAGKCVLARRDTGEKLECTLDELEAKIAELMETIQKDMLEKARKHRESHTYVAKNMEEMGNILNNTPGFVKAMWCGCQECEDKIKEQFAATSRCMPFEQETLSDTCVCCGKPAKKMVYWGKAY